MSKRHVVELCRVYTALLDDIQHRYPALTRELVRDHKQLCRLVSDRGLLFLTKDLPKLGKHLDRCLSESKYVPTGLPGSRPVNSKVQIPKFLRGLYLLVFDEVGCLLANPDTDAIFFLRQFYYLAKKTEVDCEYEAKDREIQTFVDTDLDLPKPEQFWDSLSFNDLAITSFHGATVSEIDENVEGTLLIANLVARDICSSLGDYHHDSWDFKHGPGVCSGTQRFANKYCWTNWSERLESVFPLADCGFHSYSSWAADAGQFDDSGSNEPVSRLYCVPKSAERPRIICAEPAEHMWCQQNLWHYFRCRTDRSWIGSYVSFGDQGLNQETCRRASVTGTLSTLDLSQASDRVTCGAVSALFAKNPSLLKALAATRTHYVDLGASQDSGTPHASQQKVYKLRKYAAMGNATTFPVESLLFLTICLAAVCKSKGLPLQTAPWRQLVGQVAVFGDDLIVPSDCWETVVKTLEALGFVINKEKSYKNGFFKESCGHDYFRGHLVTPCYWKGLSQRNPESIAMTVSMHNNFYKKFLMNTARHIASTLPARIAACRVKIDSDLFGLYTLDTRSIAPLRSRWNPDLQRWESLLNVLSGTQKKIPAEKDTGLLQFFTEYRGPGLVPWNAGVSQAPRLFMSRKWVDLSVLMT